MKFIFGVILGVGLGPSFRRFVDRRYGGFLIPHLESLRNHIKAWEPPKEAK